MSSSSYRKIAVLDIGKTNAKVVVIEAATGAEIASRRMPNRVLPGPPYPHYDIEGLWVFVLEALAAFAAQPGFDAVSITTHGASAALVDREGGLAMPVLDYEHEYPTEIIAAYERLRPAFAETCSPRLPMGLNLGAQLHFLKTGFPEMFGKVLSIMTYPQYWAFRLTGIAANEATSLGCHTDLWDCGQGRYSSLVDTLGFATRWRHCDRPLTDWGTLSRRSRRCSVWPGRCRSIAAYMTPMPRFFHTLCAAPPPSRSCRREPG